MRRSRLALAAAVLVLGGLVLLTPMAEDPEATHAVRRYLANMGYQVTEGDDLPPDGGTLILLHDLRDVHEAELVLAWAERGGNLVVTDPGSAIVGLAGGAAAGPIGIAGDAELEPGCIAPAVVGVDRLVVHASDIALAASDDQFVSCFGAGAGAFLLTRRHGAGTVTLLGGASPFTNALLPQARNAALAVQVVGPGQRIVFGAPGGASSGGVWETMPDRGRAAVVAIAAAGLAYALVRARRLGRPVVEEPIAPIPASELVRAAARMYRRARATAHSGRVLREATVTRLSRRLQVGGGERALATALSRATGLPEAQVTDVLAGPEPRSDLELIHLGGELEELAARAEQGSR